MNEFDGKKEREYVGSLPVTEGDGGFRPEEMSECAGCGRRNPPGRFSCMYCGAEIAAAPGAAAARLQRRVPEPSERAFNLAAAKACPGNAGEIARILDIEPDAMRELLSSGTPVPLARFETAREADAAAEILKSYRAECRVIHDREIEDAPRRLRAMEFCSESIVFTDFNTGEDIRLSNSDIRLIVTGAVYEQRTLTSELRKGGKSTVTDQAEMSSDRSLIDIYGPDGPTAFRVAANGFDFSCVGVDKSLLAAQNIVKLTARLRQAAPGAVFADEYGGLRAALDAVWPLEARTESAGVKRSKASIGKFQLGKMSVTGNLEQFTKYSRLRRAMI